MKKLIPLRTVVIRRGEGFFNPPDHSIVKDINLLNETSKVFNRSVAHYNRQPKAYIFLMCDPAGVGGSYKTSSL